MSPSTLEPLSAHARTSATGKLPVEDLLGSQSEEAFENIVPGFSVAAVTVTATADVMYNNF
jgi:hypothetical protein